MFSPQLNFSDMFIVNGLILLKKGHLFMKTVFTFHHLLFALFYL